MRISNYAEVRDALYHRESFVHGSCNAHRPVDDEVQRIYRVWSYSTTILRYDLDAGRVLYFDNRQYSVTTSRLQSLIRAAFPDAIGGLVARTVYER